MKKNTWKYAHRLEGWFSTSVPQELFKHAIPDYVVRGTDHFSPRLSNKKMTIANTAITVQCEWIKIIPISSHQQKIYFLVCCIILVISLCVPWDEKGWISLGFQGST